MSVTISPQIHLQFFTASGVVASGYQLFTYQAGTTTKQATWTDSTQSTQNANPLQLDSQGRAYVWPDPTLLYKYVLALPTDTDPPQSPVETVDNVQSPINLSNITQALIGTTLYPRTAAEIAAGVTPTNYAYTAIPMDARRYGGAPGASVAVNNAAIASMAAIAKQAGSGAVYFCAGTWDYNGTSGTDVMWFQTGNLHIYGDGPGKTVLRPANWTNGILVADSTYPSAATILNNVLIENLTIDGTNQTAGANDTYGNGVNLNDCDFVVVRNVQTLNVKNQHIVSTYYIQGGVTQQSLEIYGCTCKGVIVNQNGIGIEGAASWCNVYGNIITGNAGIGIYVENQGGSATTNGRVIVTGNQVEGATGGTGLGIWCTDVMYRLVISNNQTQGMDVGIRCSTFSGAGTIQDFMISGNDVWDWTTGGIIATPMKTGDSTEALVSGNKLKSSVASLTSKAINVDKNATVTGNKVLSGNTGIYCTTSGQRLIGNHISIASGTTVDASAATGVIGQSNILENAAGATQSYPAVNTDTQWGWTQGYGGAVASVASINLPANGDVFQVTGTTGITGIYAGSQAGRTVKLWFAGILTITAGSDLKINGNFTTAAGSSITLFCDGTNWHEIGRQA